MSLLDDVSIVVTPNGYKAGELYAVVPVPTEGSDEVNNGDFSNGTTGWNFTDSIGVVGTYFGRDEVCEVNFTNSSTIYAWQSSILTSDKIYKVTLDYYIPSTNTSVDNMVIKLGSTSSTSLSPELDILDTWTSVTLYGTADAGEFNIYRASGTIGDKIYLDNVSVKEYTSADMDVTRATAATRVDEDGLVNYAEVLGGEEVDDGNFPLPNTNWTIEDVWTISGNSANGNGANGSSQQLVQSSVFTIGKTYKVTYDIINYVSGSVFMPNVGSSNSGDQTYSEYITATQSDFKITGINFYGSITNISVKEVTRDNVPRIDYTGGGCPHILAEPQRTNLIPYSEEMSQYESNVTVVDDSTTSPDGTNNASKVTKDGVSSNDRIDIASFTLSNATDYSISAFIKNDDNVGTTTLAVRIKSGGTLFRQGYDWNGNTLSLSSSYNSGTKTNVLLEDYGNGWWKIGYSFTSDGTSSDIEFDIDRANGTDNTSVFLWGLQMEIGSYATSYIPNFGTSAGVTRNQDIFTRDGIVSLINSTEGVLFVEMAALANSGNFRYISLFGSTTDYVQIYYKDDANKVTVLVKSGGNVSFISTHTLTDATIFNKIAVKYKENDFALWVDGVEVGTDTSGSSPSSLSELALDFNGGNRFEGKVRQLQVYNTALSDSELATLTT